MKYKVAILYILYFRVWTSEKSGIMISVLGYKLPRKVLSLRYLWGTLDKGYEVFNAKKIKEGEETYNSPRRQRTVIEEYRGNLELPGELLKEIEGISEELRRECSNHVLNIDPTFHRLSEQSIFLVKRILDEIDSDKRSRGVDGSL